MSKPILDAETFALEPLSLADEEFFSAYSREQLGHGAYAIDLSKYATVRISVIVGPPLHPAPDSKPPKRIDKIAKY